MANSRDNMKMERLVVMGVGKRGIMEVARLIMYGCLLSLMKKWQLSRMTFLGCQC